MRYLILFILLLLLGYFFPVDAAGVTDTIVL